MEESNFYCSNCSKYEVLYNYHDKTLCKRCIEIVENPKKINRKRKYYIKPKKRSKISLDQEIINFLNITSNKFINKEELKSILIKWIDEN